MKSNVYISEGGVTVHSGVETTSHSGHKSSECPVN